MLPHSPTEQLFAFPCRSARPPNANIGSVLWIWFDIVSIGNRKEGVKISFFFDNPNTRFGCAENVGFGVRITGVGIFTLCAPVFSHDALHDPDDLLGDRRGQGCGVHGAVRMRA